MAATSYRGRYGGGRDHTHSSSLRRSISPSGALRCSSASAFASSSASAFASSSPCSSALLHRSASLIRVIFAGPSPSPRSVRFAVASFHGNHSQKKPAKRPVVGSSDGGGRRRMCMCSPTTHPGSFRCRLQGNRRAGHRRRVVVLVAVYPAERTAVGDDELAGAVEGEWVRRSLAALNRPSSHQQRRHAAFEPRPSRFSVMSKAGDDDPR
nr:PREDICTED: LOW QUALITY PROTEIN: uncharacterized protein LOC103982505 [Musa acuminata subsp. malaccensis]